MKLVKLLMEPLDLKRGFIQSPCCRRGQKQACPTFILTGMVAWIVHCRDIMMVMPSGTQLKVLFLHCFFLYFETITVAQAGLKAGQFLLFGSPYPGVIIVSHHAHIHSFIHSFLLRHCIVLADLKLTDLPASTAGIKGMHLWHHRPTPVNFFSSPERSSLLVFLYPFLVWSL